ncbi:hypothetical protein LZ32DRAFT_333133 [Colletotrichum eremochloae]|nr:hypothetical protein LZ32DRAFT_333133 [Colletotrichum eremochloae]
MLSGPPPLRWIAISRTLDPCLACSSSISIPSWAISTLQACDYTTLQVLPMLACCPIFQASRNPLIALLHCQVGLASLPPRASCRLANNIVNQLPISDSVTRAPKTSWSMSPYGAMRLLLPPFKSSSPFAWFRLQP